MSEKQLTKSYVNTHDPDHPIIDDLVMWQHFDSAAKNGLTGELVLLETNQRITSNEILEKAKKFAKGLIALRMEPGVDTLSVVGGVSVDIVSLFVAATIVGLGFVHTYIAPPLEKFICDLLKKFSPKIVITGEGKGGTLFPALLKQFDDDMATPVSDELSFVKHVFYDRSVSEPKHQPKYLEFLDDLIELGKTVSDERLMECKTNVKPDFRYLHMISSGSTGQPKCIAHTQGGLANELHLLLRFRITSLITIGNNVDEWWSYGSIALLLSGKIEKLVLLCDLTDDADYVQMGQDMAQTILKERIQHLGLGPQLLTLVAKYVEENNMDTSYIESLLLGGQVISRSFLERLEKLFAATTVHDYSSSETFYVGLTRPGNTDDEYNMRMESRIFPKSNIEVRIVDKNENVVDIGVHGEIEVKTYSRFKEYRGEEELPRGILTDDGFIRTGDMGIMFPDGSFEVKGRVSDALRYKVHGNVIYPTPIESTVSRHPKCKAICVVGGEFNDWIGDELVFCIQPETDATSIPETEIIELLSQDSQWPARIIYVDSLPQTANFRKVDRALVKRTVANMIKQDPEIGKTTWYKEFEDSMVVKHSSEQSHHQVADLSGLTLDQKSD